MLKKYILPKFILPQALFISACLLFFSLGTYRNVNLMLSVCGYLSLICIIYSASGKINLLKLPCKIYLPLIFGLYIILAPGFFSLGDAKIGTRMIEAYLSGLALALFCKKHLFLLPLLILCVVSAGFIYNMLARPVELMYGDRLRLFFNHPNVLALICAWAIFFLYDKRSLLPKKLYPVAIFCSLCALSSIAMAGGRSAYIGIIMAVICLCLIAKEMRKKLLIGFILLCLISLAIMPQKQITRLASGLTSLTQDDTYISRQIFWQAALDGFANAPALGNTHAAYGSYLKDYVKIQGVRAESVRHPHNMYLDILFSWGVTGAVLFLVTFIPATYQAIEKKDLLFLASIFLILGGGIFDSSLHDKEGAILLFLPLGLMYASKVQTRPDSYTKNRHGHTKPPAA